VAASLGPEGKGLEKGDEIAVYTKDGQCAGAGSWEGENLAIAVAGTNSQEPVGYEAAQPLQFQVWDASAEVRYIATVTYAACNNGSLRCRGDGNYANDAFYTLASLSTDTALQSTASEIVAANANTEEDPDVAANTLDGDLSTRWSAHGYGVHITYELSAETSLDEIGIAWYRGDKRKADFEIALSTDGSTWTTVYDGSSSGTTMQREQYSFPSTPAQFVRITGFGNSENSWTSMTRFELAGPQDGSRAMFASKRALSIEQPIEEALTDVLTLEANYPNPFRQSTTLQYALPEGAHVTLEVYDMLGRRVAQLVNEEQRAGEHRVQVRADNWSSGTYLYRLHVDGETRTGRMTVVR
jgi:hypothetical protein